MRCSFLLVLLVASCGGRPALSGSDSSLDPRVDVGRSSGDAGSPNPSCLSNAQCGKNEYCVFEAACGKSGPGRCAPTPGSCPGPATCEEACGCDGKRYCSACQAAQQGVSLDQSEPNACAVARCMTSSDCGPTEYCHVDSPDCMVTGGKEGECRTKPQGCTEDCPGVCGCDGKFYCNACGAHVAGVNIDPQQSCMVDHQDPACKAVQCMVINDCCACKSIPTTTPYPYCPAMCKQPTCDARFFSNPLPYCVEGNCLLTDAQKNCTSDADCVLVDDCCECAALHKSIIVLSCEQTCWAPLCSGSGLGNAKARCIQGLCKLSVK
jgi:hypothetical protein